jgi:hypothetical protein
LTDLCADRCRWEVCSVEGHNLGSGSGKGTTD